MKTANIGTVSSGTMLPSDLIPALLDELRYLDPDNKLIGEITYNMDKRPTFDWYYNDGVGDEGCMYDLEDLFNALDGLAPSYCYFGAHEGDGSDFGFWPSWESINDDIHDGILGTTDAHKSQYIEVNDHGNATLYARDQAGNWIEVWAIV